MLELIIIVLGVILDRVAKVWAITLKGESGITIINGFFNFEYLENRGAAFGIFQDKKIFLVGFTGIVLIVLIVFLIKERKNSRLMGISLALIISGAIGNLYDRIFSGFVIDFILVHYKDVYYYPTFNVADILVVVGTGLLMILLIKEMKQEKKDWMKRMCKIDFVTNEEQVGNRLDMLLGTIDNDRSRSFYQKMIEREEVLVNGKPVKSKYKVKLGDRIVVEDTQPIPLQSIAEDIPINIIYEDSDIVVVNKDQGMVVHPAPGNYTGTLVNALLYHCDNLSGINGVIRPGIVHRIDKDTSGILVVAKNDYAHMKLGELFHEHDIKREYYALVEGVMKSEEGVVDKPLGRDPKTRVKMAIVKDGKRAVTHYSVVERYKGYTLVKCHLETGRTHQIRVHMASLGHPIIGDPIYGFKKQKFKLNGQMLHAKSLAFVHPTTEKYVEFDSELPEYFTKILAKLEKLEV